MEDDMKTLVSDEIKRFRESYKVGGLHIEIRVGEKRVVSSNHILSLSEKAS